MAMRLRCVSLLIASQAFGFSPSIRRQVKHVPYFLPAIRGGSLQSRMTSKTVEDDKYAWLEDVEAKECLDFAKSSNDKCIQTLGDPKDSPTYDRVLSVLESEDRIPHVSSYGRDEASERILFNFWRDKANPKGIWRKTTSSEYKKDEPKWEVVLDVDKLAEKDGISWVWKGARALARKRDPMSDNGRFVTRVLMNLSRGGSDATHLKEFDLISGEFVAEGEAFIMPEAKTRASYKSRDVLLVGSDFGPESLTDSGYPRTVREWARGTAVEDAPTVFEGEKTDVAVNGYIADERSFGGSLWQIHSRSITFYTSKYYMAKLTEDHLLPQSERPEGLPELEFKELDIQEDAEIDYVGNMLFVSLRSDWTPQEGGKTYKTGSMIYCDWEKFLSEGKGGADYKVLFEPTDRTAFEYMTVTKDYLIVSTMDNVKSKLSFYKIDDDGNSLALVSEDSDPRIRDCSVRPIDALESNEFWFTLSSYTQPSTLFLADAGKVKQQVESAEDEFVVTKLKQLPEQYDASGLVVEQRMATSKDGTEIPYFIVMKEHMELNGKNPTLLYGYGGFEISLGPHYVATSGLAWLERGGVYVEANIRGGGEFGPSWHQAALKANRNKAYEGGLLMGNMYTMRPDLFGAVHCAVPLLDMKRFNQLLAGASWMAEYGNPDTSDWEDFLYKYSPYHNIDESIESYPPMLVTTSTRDDRVHPAHARKMVKKLWDLGEGKNWPIHYYENIEGGHGGAADAKQSAFMTSLAYDFMFATLSKNAEAMD
ncbi:MAG: hypothetical protein SGBAC_002821 [Bacillariaceae sp.]